MAEVRNEEPKILQDPLLEQESLLITEPLDTQGILRVQENQNWLAPTIKKLSESIKNDSISSLTVLDEETRMSADSNSRSQTPARNMIAPGIIFTIFINLNLKIVYYTNVIMKLKLINLYDKWIWLLIK